MSSRGTSARPSRTSIALAVAVLGTAALVGLVSRMPEPALGPSPDDSRDGARSSQERMLQRLAAVLRRSRHRDAPSAAELAGALAEEGRAAIEPLFSILVERRVPPVDFEPEEQMLSEPQRDLILGALERLGEQRTLRVVERRLAADTAPGVRFAAIEVLGVVGGAEHLPRIFALALTSTEEEFPESRRKALRNACAQVLRRDPDGFAVAWELLNEIPPELRRPLVEGAGASRDARGLPLFGRVLMLYPDLSATVVAQVRLVGRSGTPAVNEELAEQVRRLLDPARPALSQAAALALGELHDFGSIPQLIALLGDSSSGARENALSALQRMTGMSLSANPEAWTAWHEEELRWFQDEFPLFAEHLGSSEVQVAAEAVQAIGRRRFRCDLLAQELLSALQREEPDLRALACAALADLGSPVAIEPLTQLLEDPAPRVAASARTALGRIVRKELPMQPPTRRNRAAEQTSRTREPDAIEAAEEHLDDSPP